MPFKKNTIIIKGKYFSYWEKNKTQAVAIIFLHGFPGSHKGMVDLAGHVFGYRLIVPDLPACGASDLLDKPYNLRNYANWLSDFLEALGLSKAIIVGHSFGARLALAFGNLHPEKAQKIILITPVVKIEGFIARLASLFYKTAGALPDYLQNLALSNGFGKMLGDRVIFKSRNEKLLQTIVKNDIVEIKKVNQKVIIDLFDEFYQNRVISVNKENKVLMLVIACGLDEIAPLHSVEEFARLLPNGTLKVIEKSGHLVVMEQPQEVADIINHWL